MSASVPLILDVQPCHGAIACVSTLAVLAGRTCLGPGRAFRTHHDDVHHIVPRKWRCLGLLRSAGLWLPLLLLGKAGCSLAGSRFVLRARSWLLLLLLLLLVMLLRLGAGLLLQLPLQLPL